MSVVAAIKDNDTIWLGCDSQVTCGYTKSTLKSQKKIWRAEDDKDLLMGGVGNFRDINILSTSEKWIEELPKLKNEINFKYIVRTVVPKIFTELNNQGRLEISNNVKSMNASFIFAYKDNAFTIEADGCVVEIDDILVMGSGARLGLGAWNSIKDTDIPIKDKLMQVIKSACENDLFVNYPIIIMNTKNEDIEVIEK